MTLSIHDTAFARLEAEGRLLNSVLKGPTHAADRYGFRGDIALKFAARRADEARPPEISAEQVIAVAAGGQPGIAFLACFLLSFEYIALLADVLGDALCAQGRYFLFVDNIDISERHTLEHGGATFHVLPIDESTVYNELLSLLYIDKTDLKKFDTAGKTDAVADQALAFTQRFPEIGYADGLRRMGPVRNPYENRPV